MPEQVFRDKYAYAMTTEEQPKRAGVLRTLVGPVMFFETPNENSRIYGSRLARERIIEDSNVQWCMKNHCLFGEGDHPEKRLNSSYPQVSHAITDMWLSEDGKTLYNRWDILDTPSGRILNTLAEYGAPIGASARGSGEVQPKGGIDHVIPESYVFKTFDAVISPSYSGAMLLQESQGSKSLYTALSEILRETPPEEQASVKIFLEGIQELKDGDKPIYLFEESGSVTTAQSGAESVTTAQEVDWKARFESLQTLYNRVISSVGSTLESQALYESRSKATIARFSEALLREKRSLQEARNQNATLLERNRNMASKFLESSRRTVSVRESCSQLYEDYQNSQARLRKTPRPTLQPPPLTESKESFARPPLANEPRTVESIFLESAGATGLTANQQVDALADKLQRLSKS